MVDELKDEENERWGESLRKHGTMKEAVEKRRQMGWEPVLDELEGKPYCEIQKSFTCVYKCPETHVCKTTGQCAKCHWDEKKYHLLARREDIPYLEEKGFVFDASFGSLCDEWSPEKVVKYQIGVDKLANQYWRNKTEKKIGKREEKGWKMVHKQMKYHPLLSDQGPLSENEARKKRKPWCYVRSREVKAVLGKTP